jgi:hypothetical protein
LKVNGSADRLRRRAVLHGILAGATVALLACGAPARATLDEAVAQLVEQLNPNGPYRHPSPAERDNALAAVDRLASADITAATELFGRIGMNVSAGTDSATGRRYALAASRAGSDRSWGMLVIDLTFPTSQVVVEVPHPGSDWHTEQIGLALFRALPRAVLLIAGAHRRAAGGTADVAHQPDSMFHGLATHLADHGANQLQLHGFHDGGVADNDIVISAGAGTPDRRTEQIADDLGRAGFDVCRAWTDHCGSLEGRTNAQGLAAAQRHPFIHLEINRSTRESPQRSTALVAVLASGYRFE